MKDMHVFEIIAKIEGGAKIKAKVRPLYNHKSRRTFIRQLKIAKSNYSEIGYDIFVQTPVFKRYILKAIEIVEIIEIL